MILVAGGDSFIWGVDLADCQHHGHGGNSQQVWPALLAHSKNIEYRCVAVSGSSNESIVREVIACCENTVDDKVVIVQWTFPWRFSFRYVEPVGWYNIDLYVHTNQFTNQWTTAENRRIDKFGIKEFIHEFYKVIGTTEYWPVYSTLKEILLLQNYLKSKNIPYMFTAVDNSIFFNHTIDSPTDAYVKNLYNQIDQNHWHWFPAGTTDNETTQPRGFYQWAMENNYPIGTESHPTESAHLDAAQLLKEKFDELVAKTN